MATFVQAPTPVITPAVTTLNIVYASNVTAGNLLVVFARSQSITMTSISDNLAGSGEWMPANPAPFGNVNPPGDKMVWYKIAGATGAMTVTVTGASGTIRIAAYEFSGVDGQLESPFLWVRITSGTDPTTQGSFNSGTLVVAGVGGGEVSTTVTAGASAPNSNLSTTGTASGFIALENSASWTGGPANPHFTLSQATPGTDMFLIGFGPTRSTPVTPTPGHLGPF